MGRCCRKSSFFVSGDARRRPDSAKPSDVEIETLIKGKFLDPKMRCDVKSLQDATESFLSEHLTP